MRRIVCCSIVLVASDLVLGCVHADLHAGGGAPSSPPLATAAKVDDELGAKVTAEQRWVLSDPRAVADLEDTSFGERV